MTVNTLDTDIVLGPPTREEVRSLYPPQLSWEDVRRIISGGDLRLLKRHKLLQLRYAAFHSYLSDSSAIIQIRYEQWCEKIRAEYGSLGTSYYSSLHSL
jgi:hypothetical protein